MAESLTLVIGFRDRDLTRVGRCLQSLQRQRFEDFRLIFVDYGSAPATAARAKSLVNKFAFATYVYSETRGLPWNRSCALNSGIRLARSPYVATTDIDMIFPDTFLETLMAQAGQEVVLYCPHSFLPKRFSAWSSLTQPSAKFPRAARDALGGFQLVATKHLQEVRGFDEYYRYWGREDRDLYERLVTLGLEPLWLTDQITLYHQWHPVNNSKTAGYMPATVWNRMLLYYLEHQGRTRRNEQGWGELLTAKDRPIFTFLDFGHGKLREHPALDLFDERPDDIRSVSRLANVLTGWQTGHALGINHARFPRSRRRIASLLNYVDRALERLGTDLRVQYGQNLLHAFLADFIDVNGETVADYYLGFPALQGVSLILHA